MKTLALFDFDGTLYKKNSLLEFTKFSKGLPSFYWGIIRLLPFLFAMKVKLLSNEKTKKKYFSYFFKGMHYTDFKNLCADFALYQIEKDVCPILFLTLENHLKNKDSVFIVTASPSEWIEPWSKKFGIEVIGTKIEIIDCVVSGHFSSKNCFGQEKVNRINQQINLMDFDSIYTYGSGRGDAEMLLLSK